jgi:predicted ATPase
MFTEIGIENFKSFGKMQHIPLKPITLLYGPNSSGKSSLIQSLLLFKQTLEESPNDEVVLLPRGNLVDLGDYSEFIHKHDEKREFKMSFSFNFLWEPEVNTICSDSAPLREDEVVTLEFTFFKDKMGDVIVKSIRLFYLRNPEPLLVYKNVLLDTKVRRRIGESVGRGFKIDALDKAMLFLESINFNSEFIKANWESYAQYYGNNANSDKEIRQWDFSADLHMLETLPVLSDEEPKARKKILRHLAKIEQSFYNNSFENFSQISMPLNDRMIKVAKCFPYVLVGREHYWNYVAMRCLHDYASLFERQEEYRQIVPIDFIILITNLLSQYLKKIIHIGPLREFPGRSYQFSGNAEAVVAKPAKKIPYFLLKRPDIVESVNHWFSKFEIEYELKVERYKRNLYALTLIDKKNGCEVSPTDVGFGISQLLPIIVQGILPDFIYPGYKIICIEQPEIHLHPRLQAELGSFFAHCINEQRPLKEEGSDDADINGNQFIIETHSEHLILRLLRLIRNTTNGELEEGEKPLRPEDVAVIYAKPTENGTELMELRISEDGDFIDKWPDGFFTEREKELF